MIWDATPDSRGYYVRSINPDERGSLTYVSYVYDDILIVIYAILSNW